jgi:propionyl-CoA carboxylase alpha chain
MIAKLVVWGENREQAITRTIEAINNYEISGVKTTLDFALFVMRHEAFVSGDFDTNFVQRFFQDPKVMYETMRDEKEALAGAIDALWSDLKEKDSNNYASREKGSAWQNNRS